MVEHLGLNTVIFQPVKLEATSFPGTQYIYIYIYIVYIYLQFTNKNRLKNVGQYAIFVEHLGMSWPSSSLSRPERLGPRSGVAFSLPCVTWLLVVVTTVADGVPFEVCSVQRVGRLQRRVFLFDSMKSWIFDFLQVFVCRFLKDGL